MNSDWMQEAAAAAPSQRSRPMPDVVPGRVLQLDADLLAYWAGGNDDTTVAESRGRAVTKIKALRDYSGSESVVAHLTTESSTKGERFLIATVKPYQGNRKSGRKPKNWGYLREWLIGYEGTLFTPKLWAAREADDGIGLQAHHEAKQVIVDGDSSYVSPAAIASADKDMRMLPGYHVDWNTFELTHVPLDAYDVTAEGSGLQFGHKWFWLQMLHGDTADNIPGLPKYRTPSGKPAPMGPKTAQDMLDGTTNNAEAFATVFPLYESFYGDAWPAALVEQAMLLWLRLDFAADMGDFLRVMPAEAGALRTEVAAVRARIKEAYAEAEGIRASGLSA